MATGVDLRESLDPSRVSMEGLGSVSDDTLAGSLEGPEHSRVSEGASLPRGAAIGRYVVLGTLGSGAMGVVYTAHDPELDRKVALKLLRPRGSPERMAAGRRRLFAEAQALARLSHPHVVGVHDVGEHDGQVFVAMELVEGRTLAAWLAEGRHPWPAVLDVLVQAGRGLAAAHARELVHRDFKPDNVMLGDDGRVRVMDFGLARAVDGGSTDDVGSEGSRTAGEAGEATPWGKARSGASWKRVGSPLDASRMPESGAAGRHSRELALTYGMVGTPAYAAPEQLVGGRGGAAADQFSFCVTLWEALHGHRPFVAETLPELAARILAGEIAEPPPDSRVPPWLRRVAERGLAVTPERRWPSMGALLQALDRGRARARRWRGVAAVGVVIAAAAGAAGWRHQGEQRRIRACEAEGAAIAEVWNEAVAAEVRDAMVATGVGHAEVTAQKLAPWLEAQARGWQDARTDACMRTEVEGSWDAEMLDRSRWCLDERRMELEALVGELRRGEASGIEKAVLAAARLGRLEPCTDALTLSRLPVPPPGDRASIAEVRAELLRSDALQSVGAYDEGLAVTRQALARAEGLAWPPLLAAARYREGALLRQHGDYAEAALEKAYFEAGRADALELQADAARELAFVVGDLLARHAEGLRWAGHQELLVLRSPDPTGLREAEQLETMAMVRHVMGEYETAKALYERVLELQERALGPEHVDVGLTTGALAIVVQDMGDHAQAKRLNERALALTEQALGPDHPAVGNYLNNLARDHRALGDSAQAKQLYERALAIWEASLGPEHPHVAQALNNLGNASADLGDLDGSKALHERALAIRERVYGRDHPQVAMSLENLAALELKRGGTDRVVPMFERVLAIREQALGAEHPLVALTLMNLGVALYELRRYDDARVYLERSLRIWDASVSPEHPQRVNTLHNLGVVALDQGRIVEASRWIEDALRMRTAHGSSTTDLASTRFAAAKIRWEAGEDRPEAIALAEQARAVFREHGPAELAKVEEWLASHRLPASGE